MNWMNTNGSEQKQWSDRALLWTCSQVLKSSVAIELAIMLCNQTGEYYAKDQSVFCGCFCFGQYCYP